MRGGLIEPVEFGKKSTHGYLPRQTGYTALFFASGSRLLEGVELPEISIVDLGTTIFYLLGLGHKKQDGRVLAEILDESTGQ